MRSFLLAIVCTLAIGCSGSQSPTAPTAPTIPSIAGAWAGTYASAQLGFGRVTLNLAQTSSTISGTWSTTATDGTGVTNSGTISGTVNTSRDVVLTMTPSDPRLCPYRFTGMTYSTERRIDGQFVTVNCTVAASGTLIVS